LANFNDFNNIVTCIIYYCYYYTVLYPALYFIFMSFVVNKRLHIYRYTEAGESQKAES